MAAPTSEHACTKPKAEGERPAKMPKLLDEPESEKEESDALQHLGDLKLIKVLGQNLTSKSIFLLATFDGQATAPVANADGRPAGAAGAAAVTGAGDAEVVAEPEAENQVESSDNKAVVLLEKTAFTEESLPELLSANASLKRSMQNDIYGVYECFPPQELSGMKTTVIYPATEKHIQKFSAQDLHLVRETYEDYQNITLPYIEEKQFNIQWVFNILDKKAEAERIVFEDADPQTGFVMLPDMKWDEKQTSNLYLIVIVHQRGIKSLRDLDASHLPLLRNIQDKCTKCIAEKYSVEADQLRAYVHYQPSYYHFHVHFTHLMFDAPGTNVGRAHLLSSVIDNIQMLPTYYQQKPLAFVLRDSEELLAKFREAREDGAGSAP